MNPTIETWNVNPLDVGPIYPFLGGESMMFAACVVFCVVFLVWKFRSESANYLAKAQKLRESNELHRALTMSSSNDDSANEVDQQQE